MNRQTARHDQRGVFAIIELVVSNTSIIDYNFIKKVDYFLRNSVTTVHSFGVFSSQI